MWWAGQENPKYISYIEWRMSVKSSIGAHRLSTKTIHTFPLLLTVKYHLACLDILLLANDVTRLYIKLERENNENSNKAFVLQKLLFPSYIQVIF